MVPIHSWLCMFEYLNMHVYDRKMLKNYVCLLIQSSWSIHRCGMLLHMTNVFFRMCAYNVRLWTFVFVLCTLCCCRSALSSLWESLSVVVGFCGMVCYCCVFHPMDVMMVNCVYMCQCESWLLYLSYSLDTQHFIRSHLEFLTFNAKHHESTDDCTKWTEENNIQLLEHIFYGAQWC